MDMNKKMSDVFEIQEIQRNLSQKTQEERDYIRFGVEQRIRSQIWDSISLSLPKEVLEVFDAHSEVPLIDLATLKGLSNEN